MATKVKSPKRKRPASKMLLAFQQLQKDNLELHTQNDMLKEQLNKAKSELSNGCLTSTSSAMNNPPKSFSGLQTAEEVVELLYKLSPMERVIAINAIDESVTQREQMMLDNAENSVNNAMGSLQYAQSNVQKQRRYMADMKITE